LDLAGGHAEADGELTPGGGVGLVSGLELLLEYLSLSTGGALSVLDLVRAVVVKRRDGGFSGRLRSRSELKDVRMRGWVRGGTDDWVQVTGADEGLHGGLLDGGEGGEGAGGERGERRWLVSSCGAVFRLVRRGVESQRAVYNRAVIHLHEINELITRKRSQLWR
jgi:hypothetical protein